ncbi:MAG: periplasmic heavy metal sensor [Rubrivivax sp.]|nr:periplasmic heavy metal sensor [Rubrivivax sp.]
MKTWIKRTLIGLLGAGVLFGGWAAWAHRHHHWSHAWQPMSESDAAPLKARLLAKAGDKLELNDAQKAKLGVLLDRVREQRNALIGSGGDPRAELRGLVAGTVFDREKARALVDSKTAAVQGQSPAVIAAMADFFDSLNPQQQARVREVMERGRRWERS